MAFFSIHNVSITGLASAVPKTSISNYSLKHFEEEELQKLIQTIGIEQRRVAPDQICSSDLCVAAAEKLIDELNWNKEDIDALFFVTQTPDYLLPGTSLVIQDRLGLPRSCVTFDINQGCAGYVYGLSLISSFMSSSKLKKGLLLVGDTITKLIAPEDKSLGPIFSDCGTATALVYDKTSVPLYFNMDSEGKDHKAIMVQKGGSREPLMDKERQFLSMKGLEVFNFSLKKVVPNIETLFLRSQQDKNSIDKFVFHQANSLILGSIANKLNLDKTKVPSSLKEFGNTSSATIPLTITTQLPTNNRIQNKKLVFSGFGVGLSLASVIIEFNDVICPSLIEI